MDKYHIYEEVGSGKHSQVFKGRERMNIEYVAIKRVEKCMMHQVVNEVQVSLIKILDCTKELFGLHCSTVDAKRSVVVRQIPAKTEPLSGHLGKGRHDALLAFVI